MRSRGVFAGILLAASAFGGATRHEIRLNGSWDCVSVTQSPDGVTAPTGPARKVAVPGYLSGHDYVSSWVGRSFDAPEAMRGHRLKLRFGGVKYDSRVHLNGKHVGGHFGGYEPFELDVTDAVRFGEKNLLAVECRDWTGVFTPGRVDFSKVSGWDSIRGAPRDKILAPIGGLYGLYGIWDDVTLVSHPAVYIQDFFIKPSVRRGELVVHYTLANESAADAEVELSATVEDAGRSVLSVPKANVTIPAGKTATATLRQPWPNPHLWSHVDPHLYVLKSEIGNRKSEIRDEVATRFGFREFWCEGPDFYLNGSKIHLLASSGWPPHEPRTREQIADFWRGLKACGCVAFRTHTQPWPAAWYDVADEVGILVCVEGAVWNDDEVYRVNDQAFWDNYAQHLQAMVARDRNHPSVVMWSLENEFTGGRVNDNTPFPKEQLIRLGKLVKQLDPTRPIIYESDGDPGGVADVIGIHYPHEYPDYTCWPNEAYWLDKPSPGSGGGGIFLDGEKEFLWKRNKPLYIGEFLWVPSSDPSWHTVFFGDDAYLDYHRYRNLAKAESWKMAILGYRHFGVSGICPWTVTEGGPLDETNVLWQAHKYAYQPIAAYCLDYDRRFYSGEKVARRVEVFNDILEPSKLALHWTLSLGGKVVERGGQELALGPAEQRVLTIVVPMPVAERRTPLEWRVTLERNGTQVFEETHRYAAFPRLRLPPGSAKIGLYDPKGTTRKLFQSNGVPAAEVASLGKLDPELDVLVVGARALEAAKREVPVIGRVAPEREALQQMLARGGRVLVLEQEAYPEGLLDVGLSGQASTMAFPLAASHPALRGVERNDLAFWRGDHLVAAAEPPRPAVGGYLPLVVSGSAAGLDHAPLIEQLRGSGTVVFSQLKLVEKFDTEPAAAQILSNLLDYLCKYRPVTRKAGVVGGSKEYHACLRSLGLRFDDLTGKLATLPPNQLPSYFVILCRGEVADEDLKALRRYLELAGRLVLHRWPSESFKRVRDAFALDLNLQPYSGPVSRAEGDPRSSVVSRAECDLSLLELIPREDLHWLGDHRGISWAETDRATNAADGAFALTLDPAKATAHEVETWALEGGIVERRPPGVVFATVGSATAEIEFPTAGTYVFGLVASGTPCEGVYPLATVAIDGKLLGTVALADNAWRTYTTFGHVEQGRHKVTIAFINDASRPPKEDRNLLVDKLLIARQEKTPGVVFLTAPPAVALARCGRGLLVVDQLRWDTEERNARKAARYASMLLTALGGDFTPRPSVTIECETMTPQPDMPWFSNRGSFASLACSGWIKTPIQVAATGRYTMEVVAGGTPAQGVYPHVEISIDGRKAGEVQLTGGGLRPYPIAIELPEGKHELSLAFTNDLNVGGEDRNLILDKVVFYKD
jgi:hypothetical protein